MRQGCDGWDKLPCLFSFIQIPRIQGRPNLKRTVSGATAAAAGGLGSAPPYGRGGGDDTRGPRLPLVRWTAA